MTRDARQTSARSGRLTRQDAGSRATARNTAQRAPRRNNAIDGLRVLAMIAIVIYHANATWLPGGFIGVTVFFTLSGYLIADSLLREIKRTGTIDILRFYQRRILRLVPLMVAVVAVTAILTAIFAPNLLVKMRPDALPALLFCENWWYIFREQSYFAASGLPSPLTHFWFLGVLGQFYLVWPIIALVLARLVRSRTWQRRVVGLLTIGFAALAIVLFNPSGDPSRVYYGTDTRMAEILVGCWLAYAWPTDGQTRFSKTVNDFLDNLPISFLLDILGLAALIGLGVLTRTVNGYSTELYRGGYFGVAVLTAIVVAAVTRQRSLLAMPLGIKPFVVIAARSFGVYLWHYPLLLIMNPATRTTALPAWGWALEALVIALTAELSYHLVEQPFQGGKAPEEGSMLRKVGVGITLVFAAISTLLIVVGPFWYTDGALQQANRETEQAEPAEQDAEKEKEADEKIPDAVSDFTEIGEGIETEGHRAANAVVETARALERRIHGYTLDEETGKTNAPVILIGDSVPAGAIDQFYEIFPYGYINAEVGRQLYVADDVYLEEVAAGNGKDVVVFSSGDNGVAAEEDVQALIDAAAGHQVYLVTTRVPLPLQDMNNALFAEFAEKYDNVNLIDWYAESEGHDEYFWDDGTHLRPEGAEAYVLMLRRAIIGE